MQDLGLRSHLAELFNHRGTVRHSRYTRAANHDLGSGGLHESRGFADEARRKDLVSRVSRGVGSFGTENSAKVYLQSC